jgi:predicted PurR-regulated permease PerM
MQTIEISTKTIIKTLLIVVGLWVAYRISNVLIMLFIVALLAAALEPTVVRLSSWKIPRIISILIIYLLLALLAGAIIYLVLPPLVSQLGDLANNLPDYLDNISSFQISHDTLTMQKVLESVTQNLNKLSSGVFSAVVTVFGGIVSALTILVLTFYILLEGKDLRGAFVELMPSRSRGKTVQLIHEVSLKLGMWLRGQIGLMITVGTLVAIGLAILRVPYPLALGLIAAVLEIIPVIGPIIAGSLAVLLTFVGGAQIWQLMAIIILYVLVQQIENQILVPKIMNKAIGVSPVVIIVAILVGGKLLGPGGAVLAIPVVAVASVFSNEYLREMKNRRSQEQ